MYVRMVSRLYVAHKRGFYDILLCTSRKLAVNGLNAHNV